MVKYRKEIGRNIVGIERETTLARQSFLTFQIRDEEGERLLRERLENRFLVKGRVVSSRVFWDVFRLCGKDKPILIAGGFVWQEEAIAFARDQKLGRNSISFGGMRAVFGKAKKGAIASPVRSIELPGKDHISVRPMGKGVVVG